MPLIFFTNIERRCLFLIYKTVYSAFLRSVLNKQVSIRLKIAFTNNWLKKNTSKKNEMTQTLFLTSLKGRRDIGIKTLCIYLTFYVSYFLEWTTFTLILCKLVERVSHICITKTLWRDETGVSPINLLMTSSLRRCSLVFTKNYLSWIYSLPSVVRLFYNNFI